MIRSGTTKGLYDAVVNPLVFAGGLVEGFISSRLMAAYSLDDGHVVHVALHNVHEGRLVWHYLLERNGAVIVEGFDLSTVVSSTYGDVAREALDFLTGALPDWFNAAQGAWHAEHAASLRIFSLDPED